MKPLVWIASLTAACVLFWVFPAFHIVRGQGRAQQQSALFDAAGFARKFWQERFFSSIDRAVALPELLAALASDAAAARRRFGHSPGVGLASYLVVRGSGRVKAAGKEGVVVVLDGMPDRKEIELFTGMLFGNTVRDATGLLDPSEFPNSQHFNDLAAELNRLVEAQVFPALRSGAVVGKPIRFCGCLELTDAGPPDRLVIIPVKVDWL